MFIGHFGVGLAAKKFAPELNLGILFVGCQLLDLVWPVLVLLGLEQVSVDHAATAVTPFNFIHYPYSHSLLMTLVYSAIGAFLVWRFLRKAGAALVISCTILSHWILDFITHRADLPIFFGSEKFGLGLWNSALWTFTVEVGIFVIGVVLYLKSSPLVKRKRKIIFRSMIGFLSVIYIGNFFGSKVPIDTPPAAIAGPAFAMWLIVLWAYFADKRETKT